jgi:hypothetical protein
MKRIFSLSAVLLGVLFMLSSCSKYEEGPLLSLKSKEARLVGTLVVDQVLKNGVENTDMMEFMDNMEFTFEKGGTGNMKAIYTWGGMEVTAVDDLEWQFSDDETKLLVRTKGEDDTVWSDWEESTILRLTSDELWTQEYDDYEDQWEYHFVEK